MDQEHTHSDSRARLVERLERSHGIIERFSTERDALRVALRRHWGV